LGCFISLIGIVYLAGFGLIGFGNRGILAHFMDEVIRYIIYGVLLLLHLNPFDLFGFG
jgi:hypothetical protein